jgi:two-component system sensor histidine kinase LytS
MENKRTALFETILTAILAMLIILAVWCMVTPQRHMVVLIIVVLAFVSYGAFILRYTVNPDQIRARQTVRTLYLARKTATLMSKGLTHESAEGVCDILLPQTTAVGVLMTNTEEVLGYAGIEEESINVDDPVSTRAMMQMLSDGIVRVLLTPEAAGVTSEDSSVKAAIAVPLIVNKQVVGGLKLLYHTSRMIDETQQAMAEGLGRLLSTQLVQAELEQQTELATHMELKALQAQINPHFLFNTINTIASLCRTDAEKARVLLREFAVFYRRTLENSEDLITMDEEIDQTKRYFGFELARFGEERIELTCEIEPGLEDISVPSFIIQPLVENAVQHAMRDEGKLHIDVKVERKDSDVIVSVTDDGVGIRPEELPHVQQAGYGKGTGIALKNVADRLRGFYGPGSGLRIDSQFGEGTTVYLTLHDACEG